MYTTLFTFLKYKIPIYHRILYNIIQYLFLAHNFFFFLIASMLIIVIIATKFQFDKTDLNIKNLFVFLHANTNIFSFRFLNWL